MYKNVAFLMTRHLDIHSLLLNLVLYIDGQLFLHNLVAKRVHLSHTLAITIMSRLFI